MRPENMNWRWTVPSSLKLFTPGLVVVKVGWSWNCASVSLPDVQLHWLWSISNTAHLF